MKHRHLNHESHTLAAIDDIIARGKRADWIELRRAILSNPELRRKVLQICQTHVSDPSAQRYHFWMNYVRPLVA